MWRPGFRRTGRFVRVRVGVDNASGDRLHQRLVWDGIEVPAQVGVNRIGAALPQQAQHRLDRLVRAAVRPIAERRGFQLRLENRLQHQFCRGLHHPVPDRLCIEPEWEPASTPGRKWRPRGFRIPGRPTRPPAPRRFPPATAAWCRAWRRAAVHAANSVAGHQHVDLCSEVQVPRFQNLGGNRRRGCTILAPDGGD